MYEIKIEKCKECGSVKKVEAIVPHENYIQRLAKRMKSIKHLTRWNSETKNSVTGTAGSLYLGETTSCY